MIELEVKLKDGITAPAGSAAHQVEVLTAQMRSLQNAMIKANAAADSKAFNKAAESYKKVGEEVKKLTPFADKQTALAKAQNKTAAAAQNANKESQDLIKSLTGVDGATMGVAGAVMMAAGAYVAIGAAMAKATQFAYENAASAAKTKAVFDVLGRGKTAGRDVVKMIDELGDKLPASAAEMADWSKSMMRAGITDIPRLREGLKAVTASMVVTGDGGRAMLGTIEAINKAAASKTGLPDLGSQADAAGVDVLKMAKAAGILAKDTNEAKRRINELAATPGNMVKLGNIMQKVMITDGAEAMKAANATWEVVTQKMKDNTAKLFAAIGDTKGFKAFSIELQRLVQMFGGAEKSGQGMRDGLTGVFDVIFRVGAKALEGLQLLALNTAIAFLKFAIFIAPVVVPLVRFIQIMYETQVVAIALKGVLVALAVVFGSIGLALLPFAIIMGVFAAAAVAVAVALGAIWEGLKGVGKAIAGFDFKGFWEQFTAIGSYMVKGVAAGISNAAGLVKDAIVGLGSSAIQWFKDKIQAKSPSRAFRLLGEFSAEGYAQGVEQGTPEAAGAAARMAESAMGGGAVGVAAGAPKASGRGGMQINLSPGAIVIHGAGSPQETAGLLEESLVSIFERMALTQGVA